MGGLKCGFIVEIRYKEKEKEKSKIEVQYHSNAMIYHIDRMGDIANISITPCMLNSEEDL